MAELGALIDRAAALPPGPELSAVLAAPPWEKIPNARVVEVLQARSRQLSHEHAEAFGLALCERLPLVHAALQQGRIDLGKARVFVDYLDPANGEITEEQARRLCERFLPVAPGLTTKQLADRLYRALLAIDPALRRRRYERAVQSRTVALYLDPRTGTATLVGNGLPADEAAAAAERNDRMVDAAKRAGHPGTRGQISADIYLGMLNGAFHGLTEEEIISWVLTHQRPEDNPNPDTRDTTGTGESDTDASGTGDTSTGDTSTGDTVAGIEADGTDAENADGEGGDASGGEAGDEQQADDQGLVIDGPGSGSASGKASRSAPVWAPWPAATTAPGRSPASARSAPTSPAPSPPASGAGRAGCSRSSTPAATSCSPGRCAADPTPPAPTSLRCGAGSSRSASVSTNSSATAPTPPWPPGTGCSPRSPTPGRTATSCASGWPPTPRPDSPAARWPITCACGTATV